MKTIIAGSRDIWDYALVEKAITTAGFQISEVVCGMAPGVDACGWAYAYVNGIPIVEMPADWDNLNAPGAIIITRRGGSRYNVKAGRDRNEKMARNADALIAVWDGESTGTKHMIETAMQYGLQVYVMPARQTEMSITFWAFADPFKLEQQGHSPTIGEMT